MQVEVASYLFLVGLFGLKAPPAYILAACNHRIFQSDNCKVSRTINKKRHPSGCLFLLICIVGRKGLSTRLRKQKSRNFQIVF